MRIGKWNGRDYSGADLDAMVSSFSALRGVYDPPAKLGHNPEQKLLASDGLPAAGWVSNLYRVRDRLVADFKDVPQSVADLIKTGAYKKRSAEIWFNAEFGEKVHRAVLKAVSWLGADAPAVDSLSDVFEMYTDPMPKHPVITVTYSLDEDVATNAAPEASFDTIRAAVYDALCECYPYVWDYDEWGNCVTPHGADMDCPSPSIRDMYADYVVVNDQEGSSFFKIPFTYADSGEVTLGDPERVAIQYVAIPDTVENKRKPARRQKPAKPTAVQNARVEGDEAMQDAEIRTLLGLDETADIKAELVRLKATHVELADHTKMKTELEELKARDTERTATELVEKAIAEGKVTPAMKDWAINLAKNDQPTFEAYTAAAPKIVDFKVHGKDGETNGETNGDKPETTAAELEAAKVLGLDPAKLHADERPMAEKLAEAKKLAVTAGKA